MGVTPINTIQYVSFNQANSIISIVLDKEIFFPGETVSGEVWILSPSEIFLTNIHLRLIVEEKWTFVESSDSIFSDVKNICLWENGLIEQNNNQSNQLMLNLKPHTKFQFKFSFPLPKDLHPSFEYPCNNRTASIRYSFSGTIMGPSKYPVAQANIIIKSRPRVLFQPLNYSSCVNVHTWGVMENGTTIMSVAFPSNNFRYKDVIPVIVTINNKRGELETRTIKLELLREMTLFGQAGGQKYNFSKTIKKAEYPFICLKNSTKTEGIAIQFIDDDENSIIWNTPYPSLKDKKGMFMGSVESTMIHCKYTIKATCYFSSLVGYDNRPRIIAPLSMTYQLNDEFQLEQKENEDMKKALFESKIEFDNIKENEKNCLIDDYNENDFKMIKDMQKEKDKDMPMQMSIINDVYQVNQFINNNNNNNNLLLPQQFGNNNNNNMINHQPIQDTLNQKPADFVDINAL